MATVVVHLSLLSSLIVTMINGGFPGGVMIIFSGEAALDPMCGASNEWFCSPTDFDSPGAAVLALAYLTVPLECEPVYGTTFPPPQAVPLAYNHASCAADHSYEDCADCLSRATQQMRENCHGKDGAQYGTEECCARYEKTNKFCGR
ncbi:unnamed protein product [Linum trigynum]|uniref:Gnk2-homologous domain-containing protein n=1 Tax=Linum trigynum TaxID=586398 RepID=A0AAV2CLN9_9ROSI